MCVEGLPNACLLRHGRMFAMTDEKRTGNTGDTVLSGYTKKEKVLKVKPDGTRVTRTKQGTLKEDKNPKKEVKRPTEY
jgi:hypothetical protein